MTVGALIVEVRSCRNSCLFCKPKGFGNEIDPKKIRDMELHLYKQVKDLKKKGYSDVEISGSDPIEYEKIGNFIGWLKKKVKIKNLQLSTHGRHLKDTALVRQFAEAKLDKIKIPLYGADAKIHDAITNSPGSFDETIAGLDNLQKLAPDIEILITSMITKHNYKDLLNIMDLAKKYSKDLYIGLPCVSPLVDGEQFMVSLIGLGPYLRELINKSEEFDGRFNIADIPFCVFGDSSPKIINQSYPPETAESYSIPEQFKSEVQGLPSYRIKKKLDICKSCKYNLSCDGFYADYVKSQDLSDLKPISKE